jgi:hypothetical protein
MSLEEMCLVIIIFYTFKVCQLLFCKLYNTFIAIMFINFKIK